MDYIQRELESVRELALNDPRLFFQTYKPPILIDEI